jgi:SAM-dependent methyltransferase
VSTTESAAAWSAVAGGWEKHERFMSENARPVTERLLALLDPAPGQTILEIGAGTGEVGRLVAERVGPDGRVLVTDQSEAMVDAARRRSADHDNVEVRVLDGQAIDLASGSVDGIVSRFAYMLMPDPATAFRESRRVLAPGGRLAFAVWTAPGENPWGATIGPALVELGLAERPDPDAPGPYRLADPERLRSLVAGAGFIEPRLEAVDLTMRYASLDDYWSVTRDLSMSLREAFSRLSEGDAARLRTLVDERLERYLGTDGLDLPGRTWVVLATA